METTAEILSLPDFLKRPARDDGHSEELIDAELIVSPAAKVSHALIVRRLTRNLAILEDQGFVLLIDFGCILGNRSMLIPDLSVTRKQRCDAAAANDDWLVGSPELVVEVASPSNRKLHLKAETYLEHGAEQVWIVYPATKTILVSKPNSTTEARLGESVEFHSVQVPVRSVFPD